MYTHITFSHARDKQQLNTVSIYTPLFHEIPSSMSSPHQTSYSSSSKFHLPDSSPLPPPQNPNIHRIWKWRLGNPRAQNQLSQALQCGLGSKHLPSGRKSISIAPQPVKNMPKENTIPLIKKDNDANKVYRSIIST